MKVTELLTEAPKGPDWKVQYKFKAEDGKSFNSGTITVKDYVGKDRAKAAAEKHFAKKLPGKEVMITRITQVPWDKAKVEEAYTPPERNKKLGFNTKNKIPTGETKEWLKTFGATEQHVEQAMRVMKQSAVLKKLKHLGLEDVSSPRALKNGSIMLVGEMNRPADVGGTVWRKSRVKFTVQANGRIQETQPNDWHRAPVGTYKPHIVPGDPVGSITKTMTNAMEKLADIMTKRRDKEKRGLEAAAKKNAKKD